MPQNQQRKFRSIQKPTSTRQSLRQTRISESLRLQSGSKRNLKRQLSSPKGNLRSFLKQKSSTSNHKGTFHSLTNPRVNINSTTMRIGGGLPNSPPSLLRSTSEKAVKTTSRQTRGRARRTRRTARSQALR